MKMRILVLIVAVGTTAGVFGFQSEKAVHACTPYQGYGTNVSCLAGDVCGTACGVDYAWCAYETCGISGACKGIFGSQTIACVTGGCYNGFSGNCKCL